MNVITEIIGLDELKIDTYSKKHGRDVIERHAKKFGQLIKNNITLKVLIKQYDVEDSKQKYSIKTQLIFPSSTIAVDKAYEWDIIIAIQKAMKDMENSILKKISD
mgnify:FL=1